MVYLSVRRSVKISLHRWTLQGLEDAMLGNTGRSRMLRDKLSLTSILRLIVYTGWKSPIQNHGIIWEYQIRGRPLL